MARDNRLKFIQLDSDFFDKEKVFLIEQEFGFEGGYIAIRLLLWIAQREGWGIPWGKTGAAYFASKGLGDKTKTKTVQAIAERLTAPEIGFFDRDIFEAGYLTSRRIFRDWKTTMIKNKREIDPKEIPDLILKITGFREPEENPPEPGGNPAETRREPEENPPESAARVDKNRLDNIYTPSTRTREGNPPPENAETTPYSDEERQQAEKYISLWNEITAGTDREFTDFYTPEILITSMIDRIRQEPREEIWRRVFVNARDEPFRWTLPAVFNKPDNFNQLKISIKPREKAIAGRPDRFGSDRPGFGKVEYYD